MQSPSCEAYDNSTGQEIHLSLLTRKMYYSVC
jgi:hypothetical protein